MGAHHLLTQTPVQYFIPIVLLRNSCIDTGYEVDKPGHTEVSLLSEIDFLTVVSRDPDGKHALLTKTEAKQVSLEPVAIAMLLDCTEFSTSIVREAVA